MNEWKTFLIPTCTFYRFLEQIGDALATDGQGAIMGSSRALHPVIIPLHNECQSYDYYKTDIQFLDTEREGNEKRW